MYIHTRVSLYLIDDWRTEDDDRMRKKNDTIRDRRVAAKEKIHCPGSIRLDEIKELVRMKLQDFKPIACWPFHLVGCVSQGGADLTDSLAEVRRRRDKQPGIGI